MNKSVATDFTSAGTASPVALTSPGQAPAPRPRRRLWIVAAVAIVGAGAIAFAIWRSAGTASGVTYVTTAAARGDVTRAVTATGTDNPVLTIIVGSYESGVIKEIRCDYNTEDKVGQVCAEIDPAPYQTVVDQNRANLAVARAQLEKDKANLAYAQLNYDRNARLAQTNAVSKDVLDNAKNTLDQATAQIGVDQATIQQREAQLAAAEVNLGYTHIVSPVNGTVVSRNVTMGQTVAASFQTPTMFLIATDLTQMQVDTNVSESDIGGLKEGNRATFTVDAFPRRTFRGTVSQVRQSPQTVQNVVTYDVVLSVDNKDLALKPGMTAATRVIVDQRRDVLRVPSQALRYAPPSAAAPAAGARRPRNADAPAQVYVLRDNAPAAVPVTIGLDDDTFTEIVGGDLKPGDRVIVSEQRGAKAVATPRPRL